MSVYVTLFTGDDIYMHIYSILLLIMQTSDPIHQKKQKCRQQLRDKLQQRSQVGSRSEIHYIGCMVVLLMKADDRSDIIIIQLTTVGGVEVSSSRG